MSHSNISIFVSHIGCPNQCSFCNQKHITGQAIAPTANDVDNAVNIAVNSENYNSNSCEIAFFGGSFTAIEKDYMLSLLTTAHKQIKLGNVCGIRISTRPDCINAEILEILKKYGVTAIELGAQSMCDGVLKANKRGHTAEDVLKACELIKSFGFELGLQMMTGLYCSDENKDIETAKKFVELKPDTVRIYPTIVLKNTDLERLYLNGEYSPQSLEDAVQLCEKLNQIFINAKIRVIRVGLHSIDMSAYVAGPWHPSFRELCDSYYYRNLISKSTHSGNEYNIFVNSAELSKTIGQRRSNVLYFQAKNIKINVFSNNAISKRDILIKEVK